MAKRIKRSKKVVPMKPFAAFALVREDGTYSIHRYRQTAEYFKRDGQGTRIARVLVTEIGTSTPDARIERVMEHCKQHLSIKFHKGTNSFKKYEMADQFAREILSILEAQ